MPNTVRCKFTCVGVTKRLNHWRRVEVVQPDPEFLYEADFTAVVDGSPENKAFFSATPSGTLKVATYTEDVFAVGKAYYLDITLAE